MKPRERMCAGCSDVIVTCSRADRCNSCRARDRSKELSLEERTTLESDYADVEGPVLNVHNQRTWTFTHEVCGTRQTWTYSNILKQRKLRPDSTPCKKCGGKERMSVAMQAYIDKYGRDFDVENWLDYRQTVRKISEANYKARRHIINPLNLKRGMKTFHLDHKIPIIHGFMNNMPAELIGAVQNLQILPAFDNVSKGRKVVLLPNTTTTESQHDSLH